MVHWEWFIVDKCHLLDCFSLQLCVYISQGWTFVFIHRCFTFRVIVTVTIILCKM